MAFMDRSRRILVACVGMALATEALSAQLLRIPIAPCAVDAPLSVSKLDAALQYWTRTATSGSQQVILSAADGALSAVRTSALGLGSTVLGTLPGINAVVARANAAQLASLACSAQITSISIDAIVTPTEATDLAPDTLRATLGLPQDTPSANGVTVAVIDSGIAPSPDFGNRIAAFFDITRGALPASPSDEYGHGTHVAGLIASSGELSADGRYQGIGPRVRLVGMKVLDASGAGRSSDVIRAVELTTLLRPVLGVQIINLSLGHPIYESAARDPLVRAVETAARAGIVVVVAAGNYGSRTPDDGVGFGGITSPGNAPSAITVGAVETFDTTSRDDDRIAPYSSRGPSWYDAFLKPDLVAPGHHLVSDGVVGSTLYEEYPSARVDASHLQLSGTSMATAVASGVVALVLEAHRQSHPGAAPLTPNAVKAILQYSSTRVRDENGVEYSDLAQGAGSLNAAGAIEIARAIDTDRPLGAPWLTAGLMPMTTLGNAVVAWSQRILWRTESLYGPILDSRQIAWALDTVWGSPNVWDSHIVWGTDAVWGDESTWGSHIVWGDNAVGASDDGDHIVWGTTGGPDGTVWGNVAEPQGGGSAAMER